MPDKALFKLLDIVTNGGSATDAEARGMANKATAPIEDDELRSKLTNDLVRAVIYVQASRTFGRADAATARLFDLASRVEDAIVNSGASQSDRANS